MLREVIAILCVAARPHRLLMLVSRWVLSSFYLLISASDIQKYQSLMTTFLVVSELHSTICGLVKKAWAVRLWFEMSREF